MTNWNGYEIAAAYIIEVEREKEKEIAGILSRNNRPYKTTHSKDNTIFELSKAHYTEADIMALNDIIDEI